MNPKVSIIMPSYNHEKYVEYSIETVLAQTFADWELIIIDDGSKDKSIDLISRYVTKDKRIHFYKQENRGVSCTINRGIKLARGKYICFLDSDDAYHKDKLKKQLELIEDGYDMVLTKIETIDGEGLIVEDSFITKWFNEFDFNGIFNSNIGLNFLKKNYICKGSVMLKREIFDKYGFFNENLVTAYDYHLWLRLIGNIKIAQCEEKLKYYRWHGENETTKNNFRMRLETVLIFSEYLEKSTFRDSEFAEKKKNKFIEAIKEHLIENGVLDFFGFFCIYKNFSKETDILSFAKDKRLLECLKDFSIKKTEKTIIEINTGEKKLSYYFLMAKKVYKERGILSLLKRIFFISRRICSKIINKILFLYKKDKITKLIKSRVRVGKGRNILFIVPWMTVGGGDKVNLDIALNINKNKFSLHFVTTENSKNEWSYRFKKITQNVFHLPKSFSRDLFELFILEYIKIAKIKTVVISNSSVGYDCVPKIRERFPDIKILDILHGEGGEKENGGFPRYSNQFNKYIKSRIVISKYLKDYLIDKYNVDNEKIIVIKNGIDVDFFCKSKYLDSNVNRSNSYHGKLVISYIGRLSVEKHPEKIIEIANEIVNIRNDKRFIFFIAGDGPLMNDLEKMIAKFNLGEYVNLMGAISDVPNFLCNSDVVLLTSEIEGIPIVILESLSMEIPVIATNVGGVSEIVIDKSNGFLVEYGDNMIKDFADKIFELFEDDSKRKEMRSEARLKILNDFNIKKSVKKYEDIFDK